MNNLSKTTGYRMSKGFYYFMSFTWGILVTLCGLVISGVLLLLQFKPHKNVYGWYFEVGSGWGGFSAGPCQIICKNCSDSVKAHEFGHSIQNCIFGPWMIIFVMIPSVIRYWYRELKNIHEPEYDYAWFEQQATMFGQRYKGYK